MVDQAQPRPTRRRSAELGTLGATTNGSDTRHGHHGAERHPVRIPRRPELLPVEPERLHVWSKGAKSLQQIIEYNNANPVEGLKYGQGGLLAAEAVETSNPATKATYEENLTQGQKEDREVIDGILKGEGDSAIMVPSGSPLVGIADRAGYPVLTVPAGFGAENSSTGGDPIGVDFIGTALQRGWAPG